MRSLAKLVEKHFWAILLLVVLVIGSSIAVNAWKAKHPGSMSVLESQAMDMSAMKPPVGASPVATELVRSGRFTANLTYTGSVAPLQEQVVYPRAEGYLKSLSVYNGDRVSANELIAVVDSPDLQSKVAEAAAGRAAAASEVPGARYDVARLKAENSAATGEVQSAKSDLVRAKAMVIAAQKSITQKREEMKSSKANVDYWTAEIAREGKLLSQGAVSTQAYQSEKAQATAADADYANKQAAIDEAKANAEAAASDVAGKESMIGVARQRALAASAALAGAGLAVRQKSAMARQAGAVADTAAIMDQYRYLRAPFAGLVTKRYASPGQFVTGSTAVADIVQIDQVRLQANVSDKDIAQIKVGSPIVAHFAKDPNLIVRARVTSISPLADQSSRTSVVEAVVSNPGHKMLPGDSVSLDIAVASESNAISVPSSAVITRNDSSAVWVVRQEAAKGKTLYTCTMHPEVVSDKPGLCPKCGMPLVPKASGGAKKAHLVMVTTGQSAGDRIEITSGLKDCDEVIYQGNTYIKEGDTVSPTKWGSEGPEQMPSAPAMEKSSGGMENMPGM